MDFIIKLLSLYKYHIIFVILIIVAICLLYKIRTKDVVRQLIVESIQELEEFLNSNDGQNKLDIIEQRIKEKISTFPFLFRILAKCFCSKYWIVTTIETLLNEIQDVFDESAEDVDIKGNEINKKKELK